MTLSGLASEIGISDASLNRKMSGKSDFTRLEIQHIRMVLRMTPDEADAIFLHQNLRKRKSGVKKQPADGGREVRGMGIVGPMGAYGAANDTDLTQHLVAELRKAMEAKSAAQRDANGNKYVPVDYFVVWQTVELLERRLLPTDQQPDKGITEIT